MTRRSTAAHASAPTRVFLGFVILAVIVSLAAFPQFESFFQSQAGQRGKDILRLTVEGINGALRRYEPLPGLIAERPELVDLLKNPEDPDLVERVNENFRQTAFRLHASDVYLMEISGLTIAASSYKKEKSFVGRSFGYRPYFTQALEGGLGRYFALGTTSNERGYFFAAPVEDQMRVVGVVAVKFTVDQFEQAWREADTTVLVSDLNDVIFMASNPDWHFRTLRPLSRHDLAEIEVHRQYPLDRLKPLEIERQDLDDRVGLVTLGGPAGRSTYIASEDYIADAGWNVTVLVPTARAFNQAVAALAILILVIGLGAFAFAFYLQRRARLLERIEAQQSAQELLENRVAQRTADLNEANTQLRLEVQERRTAEEQLRRTQADLVQAGKLAALGQMSAALSHEFNQPLAAVKSYADNSLRLLDLERTAEARENILRISQMADRMASISKHLRNFARRPQERARPVALGPIVSDALAILDSRLKAANVDLVLKGPVPQVSVMGGHIRLQQVIVNLLNNALDSMEGSLQPRLEISICDDGSNCRICVRDNGPGLDETALENMFDPFFTTKEPGKGLGLGLSISFNIVKDFGGRLWAENHPEGGAVLQVEVPQITNIANNPAMTIEAAQ
ncbi:two-component sensor histidine kinase [Roseibium aquae]|uniref:C4-dicarboxylate transport sensor protein DctB n=1 Tax=Roseibium aquae TaxID=1323746 RepID=A0A916T895_9HYPH|nr:ATP-binding protein [Roseibium aquae]GGB34162.1 two-component sensor histidine kinase [Roseibium aquae]